MIWFSASCTTTSLPNSLGLFALPLRITSVCVSNTLSNFPSALVLPRSTRSRVWRSTCRTRGIISSSCLLALCSTDRLPRFDALGDFARKLFGLSGNPTGDFQQLDVGVLHLLP